MAVPADGETLNMLSKISQVWVMRLRQVVGRADARESACHVDCRRARILRVWVGVHHAGQRLAVRAEEDRSRVEVGVLDEVVTLRDAPKRNSLRKFGENNASRSIRMSGSAASWVAAVFQNLSGVIVSPRNSKRPLARSRSGCGQV